MLYQIVGKSSLIEYSNQTVDATTLKMNAINRILNTWGKLFMCTLYVTNWWDYMEYHQNKQSNEKMLTWTVPSPHYVFEEHLACRSVIYLKIVKTKNNKIVSFLAVRLNSCCSHRLSELKHYRPPSKIPELCYAFVYRARFGSKTWHKQPHTYKNIPWSYLSGTSWLRWIFRGRAGSVALLRHRVANVEHSDALLPSAGRGWKCKWTATAVSCPCPTLRLLAGGPLSHSFKLAVQRHLLCSCDSDKDLVLNLNSGEPKYKLLYYIVTL